MNSVWDMKLRITAYSHRGNKRTNEDRICVTHQGSEDGTHTLFTYFGVFDGHSGTHAANYAKEHLMNQIVSQENFWSDDDSVVERAIRDGYIKLHEQMWKESVKWEGAQRDGTTATVGFLRNGKLFVGHVGDSRMVLGETCSSGYSKYNNWIGKNITKDHKPNDPEEENRIIMAGGRVDKRIDSDVWRVVLDRHPPYAPKPYLAVSRTLGDFWSYNSEKEEFVVSPVPDITVIKLDKTKHRCIVLATDGLWDVMEYPEEAVKFVQEAAQNNSVLTKPIRSKAAAKRTWMNPSKKLVMEAIKRNKVTKSFSDNTSAITILFDPEPRTFDPLASLIN